MTLQQKISYNNTLMIAHRDYQKGLCRYSFFKVHNKALGEDLVQDTFIKTWTYLANGGEIIFMKAFLYRILNNLIVDEYRKHKASSLDTMIDAGFDPGTEVSGNEHDIFDAQKAVELIKLLPGKYQNVMNMRFVEDLSPTEISERTQQSKNAITVQVHRGLAKIKSLYEAKMLAGATV